MERGHPVEPQPDRHLRPVGSGERQAGLLRVGQEQLRAARRDGVEPGPESGPALVHRRQRLVVRGGYTKVFDRVGVGLATNFDEGFAFGMSTQISSPFGARYETNPGVRFVNPTTLPPTVPAAPPGGFPQTPPIRAGIITQSIDDTLQTPSAHMASVVFGRDLGRNFALEVGYIGRFGRDLLVRRDIAMPLNLIDPRSNTDYFTAVQAMIRAAQAAGLTATRRRAPTRAWPRIPYWENLFPAAAGGGLSATQAIARAFMANSPDWITALYDMDTSCIPACSIRAVRVLRRAVRLARGDQLDRPLELQRHGADAAAPLRRRHAVRLQLHAVEVGGQRLAGRARQRLRQLRQRRLLRAS